MNVLTVLLQAPAGAAGGGSMMWIMLIAMFVIMYFFMIRPQNKKQKEIAEIANIVFDRIKIEISNKAVIPIEEIGNALDKALDGKKGIKIQL